MPTTPKCCPCRPLVGSECPGHKTATFAACRFMKVSQSCLFQASSSVFINRRFSSTVRPTPPKLPVTSPNRILKRKPLDETLRSGRGKSDIRPFERNGSDGLARTEEEL